MSLKISFSRTQIELRARSRPGERMLSTGSGTPALLLTLYAFVAALPLVLVWNNSLRTTSEIYNSPFGPPTVQGIENFAEAWTKANFSVYFLNSSAVTVGSLFVGVCFATLASYALGRMRFPGSQVIGVLFLAGLLLPVQLSVVPVFYMLQFLGLVDTKFGLILVYGAQTLPLSILILTVFFRQLPKELEEAARIDGANAFQVFLVILPLVRPALATVVVVQAAPIWNDFFYPLVLLRSPSNFTVPIGLTSFMGLHQSNLGALCAALTIASVPVVVVFALATKHVVAGLTAGIGK